MVELIDTLVQAAARDVWTTMLRWEGTAGESQVLGTPTAFELMAINGSIGFGGRLTGSIFLSCDDQAATEMAHAIFGADMEVGPREASDVVGEMTNMLAGGCVSRLRDKGFSVAMSIPNIIRGTYIQATSRNSTFMVQRSYATAHRPHSVRITVLGKMD